MVQDNHIFPTSRTLMVQDNHIFPNSRTLMVQDNHIFPTSRTQMWRIRVYIAKTPLNTRKLSFLMLACCFEEVKYQQSTSPSHFLFGIWASVWSLFRDWHYPQPKWQMAELSEFSTLLVFYLKVLAHVCCVLDGMFVTCGWGQTSHYQCFTQYIKLAEFTVYGKMITNIQVYSVRVSGHWGTCIGIRRVHILYVLQTVMMHINLVLRPYFYIKVTGAKHFRSHNFNIKIGPGDEARCTCTVHVHHGYWFL